jgi:protein-disulfide isomerase
VAQSKRKKQTAGGGGQGVFYAVLAVIAVAGVAAIVYAVVGGGTGTMVTEPVELDIADVRELHDRATPKRLGEDAAPNRVVVFSDYMCGGCAAFGLQERQRIMPWIERGDVQYIAYDFPLGGNFVHSFLAARAARCAGEQSVAGSLDGTGFWPYNDVLYQQQGEWASQRAVDDTFLGYARDIGLDERDFEQCLRSDRHAETVTANQMIGQQLGVNSTPTVLVNNRRISGGNIREMGNEVLRLLEESAAGQQAAVQ